MIELGRVRDEAIIELPLTALAKARVWFCRATSSLVADQTVTRSVEGDPASVVQREYLTLEAYVPRGGRAQYGLLGFDYVRGAGSSLHLDVPIAEGACNRWLDSLAAQVDDVRLGLPREFAAPVVDAMAHVAARRFPAGRLSVVEAAHGVVGSSPQFFGRVAASALSLMLDGGELEPGRLAALLRDGLAGP